MSTLIAARLAVVLGLVVVGVGASVAQDPIQRRKSYMDGKAAAMRIANDFVRGDRSWNAHAAADAMRRIAVTAGDLSNQFPKGTDSGGNTLAKPDIWRNFEEFKGRAAALRNSADQAVAESAKGPDAFKRAYLEVARHCKSCHDTFRRPR
jgi:cytochrome c556